MTWEAATDMIEAELGTLREKLLRKREQLEGSLRKLDGIAIEKVPDTMDNVQLTGEREFIIATLDRETGLLAEVRAALERIADGSYGVCLNCEREIAAARLAAVPWAAYCVRCQEALEREREADAARRLDLLNEAA